MLGNQLVDNGLGKAASRKELMRGIDDALAGKIPTAAQREAVQQFSRANREALAASNAKLAKEFLAKNAHAPGITTKPSGLQYRVLAAGAAQAAPPSATDQVTLRYRLSLADGTVLDRSEDHPQQPVFRVNRVIPAWHEALLAMRPGAKWQLFVPPDLGYGANSPPPIPPGALLIFDLDLLHVERTPQMAPRTPATPAVPPKSP
jgi:FKBP-type peptidyl-prolyl cis-trans isomerase